MESGDAGVGGEVLVIKVTATYVTFNFWGESVVGDGNYEEKERLV